MSPPTIIALILFAAVICTIYIWTRRGVWTLEKLKYLSGEKVLFTDDAEKFEEVFRADVIVERFPNGHIVLTNKRIILAQKALFENSHVIRAAINYVDRGPELHERDMVGGALLKMRKTKNNFLEFFTTKGKISVHRKDGIFIVEILVPFKNHGPLFREELKFLIYTKNGEKYKKI